MMSYIRMVGFALVYYMLIGVWMDITVGWHYLALGLVFAGLAYLQYEMESD